MEMDPIEDWLASLYLCGQIYRSLAGAAMPCHVHVAISPADAARLGAAL